MRFPYAKRIEVYTKLAEVNPTIEEDPDRALRDGEVLVTVQITPPEPRAAP